MLDRTWSLAMPTIGPQLAEVAQLVGDPGRANILSTLMDGRALTASELATVAGVKPQTASSHLAKLVERELLTVEKRGQRRFYRLATPLVAQMLEGIMTVAATGPPRFRPPSRIDSEMRRARTCYDHLAGELGVALTDAMIERRFLVLDADAGELTTEGSEFLADLGVDLTPPSRRAFAGHVSTGANGARIWPAELGQLSLILVSSETGSAGARLAGRSKLPKAASRHSENCLVHEFDAEFAPPTLCPASTSLEHPLRYRPLRPAVSVMVVRRKQGRMAWTP